jgi:hypothetical protein
MISELGHQIMTAKQEKNFHIKWLPNQRMIKNDIKYNDIKEVTANNDIKL